MKSQLLSALTVVGVLGTATAALAVNTDTLGNVDSGAPEASMQAPLETTSTDAQPVSTPEAVSANPTNPAAPVTISPDGTITSVAVKQPAAQQSSPVAPVATVAPVVVTPVAPAPVDATTGGSGSASGYGDDEGDDESDESSYESHDNEDGGDDD